MLSARTVLRVLTMSAPTTAFGSDVRLPSKIPVTTPDMDAVAESCAWACVMHGAQAKAPSTATMRRAREYGDVAMLRAR